MDTTARDRLLDTLAEGIRSLTGSDRWRSHLELQGRFHRYSFNNVLLIGAQDPDATRVAGFATWKGLGRSVRKGERAIWILAPMVGRPVHDDLHLPGGFHKGRPGQRHRRLGGGHRQP